jgi:formylmethanofuran dehydrogenase subunit E
MCERKSWSFEITDELIDKVIAYHTKRSPGMIIGTYLLKYLTDNLGPVKGKLHVVSETAGCFADVVSCVLHRTIGNKYLRIKDYGVIAYTGYGRDEPENALRVWIDLNKIDKEKTPMLYAFMVGTRPHDKYPRQVLNDMTIEDFLKVKYDIFSKRKVKVFEEYKLPKPFIKICDKCGQSFSTFDKEEKTCIICRNDNLYFEFK